MKACDPDEMATLPEGIPETKRNISGFFVPQQQLEDIINMDFKLPGTSLNIRHIRHFWSAPTLKQRRVPPVSGLLHS
jgi:hypothetical protein